MKNTAIDISSVRRDTPGCANVLHFNNAGAALMTQQVLDAVKDHVQLEAEIGGYEAADAQHEKIEHVYDAASRLIGCRREEIAWVENATRAWDMAFYSIPFGPNDRILTSVSEYASNYIAFLHVAQRTGARVEVIPNDAAGQVCVKTLENMLDRFVKLIAITHVPTNGGLINPARQIGKIAKSANIPFLLDACQSVGQMPINVQEIGCDMLSATGRKYLRGPRGTGFLYVQSNLLERLEPPFLDLHAAEWVTKDRYKIRSDARRFENWESYCAGRVGLGIAIDYALRLGLENIWMRIVHLSKLLRERIKSVCGAKLHDLGVQKCGIVSFTIPGHDPNKIRNNLAKQKINVSVSPAQYTRLDMDIRGLIGVVRASVHYYNTEEEIERFCQAIHG